MFGKQISEAAKVTYLVREKPGYRQSDKNPETKTKP